MQICTLYKQWYSAVVKVASCVCVCVYSALVLTALFPKHIILYCFLQSNDITMSLCYCFQLLFFFFLIYTLSMFQRSGLYGGRCKIRHLNLRTVSRVAVAVWGRALSWRRGTPCAHHSASKALILHNLPYLRTSMTVLCADLIPTSNSLARTSKEMRLFSWTMASARPTFSSVSHHVPHHRLIFAHF